MFVIEGSLGLQAAWLQGLLEFWDHMYLLLWSLWKSWGTH